MNSTNVNFENEFYPGILNSFEGSCGRLLRAGRPHAILWLLVDHVLLLFQTPVYVNLWKRSAESYEAQFSSISQQDRQFLGIKALPDETLEKERSEQIVQTDAFEHLAVSVHCFPNDKSIPRSPEPLDTSRTLRTIKEMLDCRGEQVLQALKVFQDVEAQTPPLPVRPQSLDKAIESANDYLAPLRKKIGAVLDSVGRSELTEAQNGHGLNLFAVIRFPSRTREIIPPQGKKWHVPRATSYYDYSVALTLSSQQEDSLPGGIPEAQQLQTPLAQGARSIADTPLARGCVDFSLPNEREQSLWSRQYYVGRESAEGIHRKSGEDALYESVFEGPHADETIFYVPLHMGGVPWMAVFTFNQGDRSRDSMMRNYKIYRDLIPVLSESLSDATQAAFAETLADTATSLFDKHLGMPTFAATTNSMWATISHLYPYPRPQLTNEGKKDEQLHVPGFDEAKLFLVFSKRDSGLPYRLLDETSVRRIVEQQLQRAALRIQALYKDALFIFGHQAGKLFQESGLPGFEPGDDPVLQGMKNRLLQAWGMAEAIRVLKYLGRGFPEEWFSPDPSDRECKLEHVLSQVHHICQFYLCGTLQNMPESWALSIIGSKHSECVNIAQIKSHIADPLRVLPPLANGRPGEAGTLALTVGLAEIIRNARNHLQSSQSNIVRAIASNKLTNNVMTIKIQGKESAGQCSVVVRNVHVTGGALVSQTLRNVQQFEKSTLLSSGKIVVRTSTAKVVGEIGEDFEWVESKWVYRYSELI